MAPTWPALAWTGVLLGGDAARLGGLAAAHLHGLTTELPARIEVLIPLGHDAESRRPLAVPAGTPPGPATANGDNAATSDGLATLRYGKADVFGLPCEVADEVARNLMRRGWKDIPHRCDRCRNVA